MFLKNNFSGLYSKSKNNIQIFYFQKDFYICFHTKNRKEAIPFMHFSIIYGFVSEIHTY